MKKSSVFDLKGNTASLVGYGVSNQAMCDYLIKNGIYPTVRNEKEVILPQGIKGIFTPDYLDACEDIIFRSPSVRSERFSKNARVYTEISFALENVSAHKLGITGSDGKTTTTTLIHKILEKSGKNVFVAGNIGIPLILNIDKIKKDDFIACELSSFQLYDYTPSLDCAVITNITPNHLDWHASMAEYVFSKRNILKKAKRAVLYYDSSYRDFFMHDDITYFSLRDLSKLVGSGNSYVYIKNGYAYYDKKRLFPINIVKIKGEYNLLNILASIGAVYSYASIDAIIDVVSTFEGVCHRAEKICVKNGISFIDSSIDSTPSRTKATLSAYPSAQTIVILGGYDKNLSYKMLADITSKLKCVVLLGESKEKIYNAIKDTAKKIIIVNNLAEAVSASYKEAKQGDFVILSPASASFDMFKNYKERAERFKDLIKDL